MIEAFTRTGVMTSEFHNIVDELRVVSKIQKILQDMVNKGVHIRTAELLLYQEVMFAGSCVALGLQHQDAKEKRIVKGSRISPKRKNLVQEKIQKLEIKPKKIKKQIHIK